MIFVALVAKANLWFMLLHHHYASYFSQDEDYDEQLELCF